MSDVDINDVFDAIACSEETSNEQGFEEGIQKGLQDGEIDGFHLGYHKGAQIGAELGFYNGTIETYLQLCKQGNIKLNEKVSSLLEKIKDVIAKFPRENIEDKDIFDLASDIRVKFKKLSSLLKIDGTYPYDDSISY